MKLFKKRRDNDDDDDALGHNGTYDMDSDDDSIPPPPPPPPPMSSNISTNSHDIVRMENENNLKQVDLVSIVSSVKTSNEEFHDNSSNNDERSRFVTSPNSDDMNGRPVQSSSSSRRSGYSSVPITGHFRGMKNAQTFDEEEAGMDEIEVPSSSVVDRWNEWEKKYALRKKLKMFVLITLGVIVVIVGISVGSVFGAKGSRNNGGDEVANPPSTGGPVSYPEHMDTPSGRIIWDNEFLPASTIVDLEEQDEDSAAYKAMRWIEESEANQGYNFGLEDMNDKTKLDVIQRFTLATFANSVGGEINGWMSADDVCGWEGVTCGDADQGGARKGIRKIRRNLQDDPLAQYTITTIAIPNSGIEGQIPPELALLQDLYNIELFGNSFNGPIPDEIFTLPNLQILDLYDNELSGPIPTQIGNMNNLVGLYLGRNNFSGRIPAELYSLKQLIALWIDDLDQMDGQALPSDISSLENLQQLRISRSKFQGGFPEEIGSMVSLRDLRASRNGFGGELPDLSALVNLETLDLSNNWFTGELPKIRDLLQLKTMKLNGNLFSGPIWNHYGLLEQLVELRLGPNTYDDDAIQEQFPDTGLSGTVPDAIGALVKLEILDLRDNNLEGDLPETLIELENLEEFIIEGNADLYDSVRVIDGMCELEPAEMKVDCHVRCDCCTDNCNRDI